ncbi:MAG: ATP-dependent helicase HrpB [Spongiibacteraceae bacterium]|jgi:ATP-dependent helicase HrpB|nr:ATP-dependent helicase HrpB [Spongiibacteraceae bacterium]
MTLPVDEVLPRLGEALAGAGRVLLEAPPGSGKSTRFPLWLMAQGATRDRRIVLVQPRRVAAAGIARYLARCAGGPLGERVGLRTRFEKQVSANTVLEVVTEGIFLRTIQNDPLLAGIGWVLFDEFHERNWQADLGLAFALESQRDWRDEQPLGIAVMSATLPQGRFREWFEAPLITAGGRAWPVTVSYAPVPSRAALHYHLRDQITAALAQGARKVLVFLPGWSAIRRAASVLEQLPVTVTRLHSNVMPQEQERALAPLADGEQMVVLATNIAETSLTIEGVDVVIDSGRVRRPSYDPRRGMNQLIEGWVSRASAEQRAGRAGRLGPGRCIRLWSREQQGRLPEHELPELTEVDAAPVLLELAAWGAKDDSFLLDSLPPAARSQAEALLTRLGAFDQRGWLTPLGKAMAAMGLHPRLGRLLLTAPPTGRRAAAALAALLAEGDFLPVETGCDIETRLAWLLQDERGVPTDAPGTLLRRIRQLQRQLLSRAKAHPEFAAAERDITIGELLLAAYPDRLARRRPGTQGRFLTIDGFEVIVPASDPLASSEWLVVAEHDGARDGARVWLAAMVSHEAAAAAAHDSATEEVRTAWNSERERVEGEQVRRLGAVVLEQRRVPVGEEQAAVIWRQVIAEHGIEWLALPPAATEWLARVNWLRSRGEALPDSSPEALMASLDEWLLPWLQGVRARSELGSVDWLALLRARLSYAEQQRVETAAPARWQLPSGQGHRIDYQGGRPELAARLTEFYGLDTHPQLEGEPLLLVLLSPAGRPLQRTADLPGFWRSAYSEVRKEMRGRYPKHYWPEQPWLAEATSTTRRRMGLS